MGIPLFGVPISNIIAQNIGPGVLPAQLIKVTRGSRTPGSPTAGTNPVDGTPIPCRGFKDQRRRSFKSGTLVQYGDVDVVVLIGDTINGGSPASAPEPGDKIVIEGQTLVIPEDGFVDRDPAAATYTCQVKPL